MQLDYQMKRVYMKSIKTITTSLILIVLIISCEKDDVQKYDCSILSTNYFAIDEVRSWTKDFYLNDRLMKSETSGGGLSEYKYDNNGNKISEIVHGNRTDYEYNSNNQLIKRIHYSNGQISTSYVFVRQDSLIQMSYKVFNEDTSFVTNYHYSNNRLDSINSGTLNSYYYYTNEVDSVVRISEGNKTINRWHIKYKNGLRIFIEDWQYDMDGQETNHLIRTWEYNSGKVVIRIVTDRYDFHTGYDYTDRRTKYNDAGLKTRVEYYSKSNELMSYAIFIYDQSQLTRIEEYNNQDVLYRYTTYESTCD